MTAAKNLQVIRTIQKSTNFALQAKGEFQLAGCHILLSKQFHCDLQNRHKPYIPLLPSWLPKKDIFGCFFFCWNPPNCLLLRKNCCWMRRPIFGGNMKAFKTAQGGKSAFGNKNLVTGFEWQHGGLTLAGHKGVSLSEVRCDGVSFQFSINVCSVSFFTSWDSYGFCHVFDGLSRTYKRRQSILGCPVVNGLFHPYN